MSTTATIHPDGIAEVTVGYDGSEEARIALAEAIELARASGSPVKVVAVAEPAPIMPGVVRARVRAETSQEPPWSAA